MYPNMVYPLGDNLPESPEIKRGPRTPHVICLVQSPDIVKQRDVLNMRSLIKV